jgi:hypothetical protein
MADTGPGQAFSNAGQAFSKAGQAFSDGLTKWFERNACLWSGVDFVTLPDRGIFAVARQDLGRNTTIALIPKDVMLSRKTAADSAALHRLLDEGLPPVEVLSLAVSLERASGRRSRWYTWLSTLARDEPLPLLWSDAELSLLQGTNLDTASRRRRQRLTDNFQAIQGSWAAACVSGTALPTLDEYLRASTLVSSRSFRIDDEHGEALVPLADCFNHKCALIGGQGSGKEEGEEGDEVNEQSEGEMPEGGQGGRCGDVDSSTEDESCEDGASDGSGDESGAGGELGARALEPDMILRVPEAGEEGPAMLITRRRLRRGEEVCLTYSELGNWELLAGYGFTLPDNPLDTALLSPERLLAAVAGALGERHCRSRLHALRRCGAWTHLLDASFVFDRRASPPPDLILFLHLLTACEPLPPWIIESGQNANHAQALSARRADEATRISDLAPDGALRLLSAAAPPHALPADLLIRAVRAQLGAYMRTLSAEQEGLDAAKRLHARRVVDGEIGIWEAVLRKLQRAVQNGGRGGRLVGRASVGASALDTLEPWQWAAAERASRKRRRD